MPFLWLIKYMKVSHPKSLPSFYYDSSVYIFSILAEHFSIRILQEIYWMSLSLRSHLRIITDYTSMLQLTLVELKTNKQKKPFDCFLFFPAAKNKVVQLSVVRCQLSQIKAKSESKNKKSHTKRSSIQDCYRRTEVWSLQDLTLVDGRDPDVVIHS